MAVVVAEAVALAQYPAVTAAGCHTLVRQAVVDVTRIVALTVAAQIPGNVVQEDGSATGAVADAAPLVAK